MAKDGGWSWARRNRKTALRQAAYKRDKLEQIVLTLPKGQRERYNEQAKALGVSTTRFFLEAVEAAHGIVPYYKGGW